MKVVVDATKKVVKAAGNDGVLVGFKQPVSSSRRLRCRAVADEKKFCVQWLGQGLRWSEWGGVGRSWGLGIDRWGMLQRTALAAHWLSPPVLLGRKPSWHALREEALCAVATSDLVQGLVGRGEARVHTTSWADPLLPVLPHSAPSWTTRASR